MEGQNTSVPHISEANLAGAQQIANQMLKDGIGNAADRRLPRIQLVRLLKLIRLLHGLEDMA